MERGLAMLQDEDIGFIHEQFIEKNEYLFEFGQGVSPWDLYDDVFGTDEITLPVVIIDEEGYKEKGGKHIVPMELYEAIEQAENRNDMLLGGCTYFNNWISKRSCKDIHAFIIDMDNVYAGTLLNALQDDWKTASGDYLPKPTYIVNSGTGLHLYYVLTEPIPNYKDTTENLDKLYRALAIQQTTRRVYLKKQVQWFGQDFRIAGGLNKYGWTNTIFRYGEKWDIDELAKAVGMKDVHFVRYGEKRTQKPKERKTKRKSNGWKSNRAFYNYALKRCYDETKEGNRYMSMCALSVIAWKCGVPQEELERDLLALLPKYNQGASGRVKENEVYSAMKMYNEKAMLTQRMSLEHWQGWEYKPIKRNGRKQDIHLTIARATRDILHPEGWQNKAGRPTKENIVREYRREHPDATKTDVVRATGMTYNTVRKYWNCES